MNPWIGDCSGSLGLQGDDARAALRRAAAVAPIDEDRYPVPASTYALSKVASETVAQQVSKWSGILRGTRGVSTS